MRKRLIPIILLHNSGVYKTTKFSSHVYIGDPINTVRLFNDMEVDEIFILDIDASKQQRAPDYNLISAMASEAFMPICYGGGIDDVEIAKKLFKVGIDKISFNSPFLKDPTVVKRSADVFGSQSIVVSLDYKPTIFGKNKIYSKGVPAQNAKWDLSMAVEKAVESGAGEILINNMSLDGKMTGLDLDTISEIAKQVKIPIVGCGGLGSLDDALRAFESDVSGIAGGSFFVFKGKQKGILISYPDVSSFNGGL